MDGIAGHPAGAARGAGIAAAADGSPKDFPRRDADSQASLTHGDTHHETHMGSPYRFAPRAATMIAGTASAITALATFAAANLTLAAPARAETPTMSGTYAAHVDTDNETWTATPCGPGCADITFGTHGSARARLVG